MTPKYVIQDERGNAGTNISLTQGESKTLKILPRNADDTTMILGATSDVSEAIAKVYAGVSAPSIQKKLSLTTLSLINEGSNCVGVQFDLAAADTTTIVANSSGIPILVTLTIAGKIVELNFLEALLVDVPVVTN